MPSPVVPRARPRPADPAAILRDSRKQAVQLATQTGVGRMHRVLATAAADLKRRLETASELQGPGPDSFTAAQLQSTLVQVRAVLGDVVQPGLRRTVLTTGDEVASQAATDAVDYMRSAELQYTGVNQPLAIHEASVMDRAAKGAESSLLHRLEGTAQAGPGILRRYGAQVVENFEGVLQQRFVARVPWGETRDRLVAESPFLQGAPAHWAERIVRSELMGAHNRASFEAMQEADEQLGGDMLKILCATFDDRTAADSYAAHGQIRRVDEPFDTWQGPVMTPPARPNDREVVVPHRMSWPLPANLKPRSASEVAARWASEGRKGAHPPIPRYSTVDVSQIGKVPPPTPRTQVGAPALGERSHPSALHAPVRMPMGVVEETPEILEARRASESRQDMALGLRSRHEPRPELGPSWGTRLEDGSYRHSSGARLVRPEPRGDWYLAHPSAGMVNLGRRATFDTAEQALAKIAAGGQPTRVRRSRPKTPR